MTDDLRPMKRCRADKQGRHELSFVIPEDSTGFITMACDHCGAVRRIPASGYLTGSLDDLTADEIERAMRR